MTEKELYDLASKWVCPNSGVATTQYEIHAVRNLVMFGTAVLAAAQQCVQPTDGTLPDKSGLLPADNIPVFNPNLGKTISG